MTTEKEQEAFDLVIEHHKNAASENDIRYTHPADGTVTGYATMTNGNTRADASGKKGMKLQAVTLLERGNGYWYGRGPNETPKRD